MVIFLFAAFLPDIVMVGGDKFVKDIAIRGSQATNTEFYGM